MQGEGVTFLFLACSCCCYKVESCSSIWEGTIGILTLHLMGLIMVEWKNVSWFAVLRGSEDVMH